MQLSMFDPPPKKFISKAAFAPRPYQSEALENVFGFFEAGNSGVMVRQPTGTGKTVTGTLVIERWLAQGPDYRALVLAHERQLIHQFAEEISDILKINPGIEMGKEQISRYNVPLVTVACRASLLERETEDTEGNKSKASRLYKFDTFKFHWLILLDEAHRWRRKLKSCEHILDWFDKNPKNRRLGLTATPKRGDKVSLETILPNIAADYRLYDPNGGPCAVRDGWCVGYDQRFIQVQGLDFSELNQIAGDFDEAELSKLLAEENRLVQMVQATLEKVGKRQTIIFCPQREKGDTGPGVHQKVASLINGLRSNWKFDFPCPGEAIFLDGDFDEDGRKEAYRKHQSGDVQFLCVVGLCREGYNDPNVGAVVIYRPTKSQSLAEQMKGRGCRVLRGLVDGLETAEERLAAIAGSAKPNCMVVDLVGVTGLGDCASTAAIYAEGLPDEVIERANKNMAEKQNSGETVDVQAEVEKARRELEAEKLKKKAERLARMKPTVLYDEHNIPQGGYGATHFDPKKASGLHMLFGKHKGSPIESVPKDYLKWKLSLDLKPWYRNAIEGEIARREGRKIESKAKPAMAVEDINKLLWEATAG